MRSKFFRGLIILASSLFFLSSYEPPKAETITREALEIVHDKRKLASLPVDEMMRLYIDCNHKTYFTDFFEYTKTPKEISQGASKRKNLEAFLRDYFNEEKTRENFERDSEEIYDPLGGRGNFQNSFDYPRIRLNRWEERHEGIDIFAKLGSKIYAPVSGVVVASSDDWVGHWDRKKGLVHEGGGLSSLSGNGVLLFSPKDTSYYFMIHMDEVYVNTGDVISQGTVLGNVGESGNPFSPYSQPHLHLAWKKPGFSCNVENALVAQNPYQNLVAARKSVNANN